MLEFGDASSEEDLERAYKEARGTPFDVVIDNASHINWHQIRMLDFMLPHLAPDGLYFVEDIQPPWHGWSANIGTHQGDDMGSTADFMTAADGKETIR